MAKARLVVPGTTATVTGMCRPAGPVSTTSEAVNDGTFMMWSKVTWNLFSVPADGPLATAAVTRGATAMIAVAAGAADALPTRAAGPTWALRSGTRPGAATLSR